MNKKLLTLEDLYSFYSQKKKSMTFSADKSGYNIAVQSLATFELNDDLSEGLLYGKIRAFHDLTNNNKSHIETDVLEEKMMSIKDRPVMADIVDTDETDEDGNPIKDFSGHTMYYDEALDKMIYKEIPIGHFIHPESIHLEYDEEYDRNFVCADVVVYEEYTDACDILRRRKTVDCSVELCIRKMHWDNTDKTLHLDDFYVQGTTLLGSHTLPGMSGSKLSIKDFSEENNSLFSSISEDEHSKLIETLDNLNKTLSSLNINSKTNPTVEKFEKGGSTETNMTKFEELLGKYNKTVEDITFEYEGLSDEELEEVFSTTFGESEPTPDTVLTESDKSDDDTDDDTDDSTTDEPDDTTDDDKDKDTYSKTFELSHEDVRSALYQLLAPIEETLNEYYWIMSVYDDYFIYESCCGNYYKQAYTKENDTIAFDGERQELFAEFVTADEKAELEDMRANYSSISEKLARYEEAEEIADKMTVFEDQAYSKYLETDEFKQLMNVENVKKFTKDELVEKADAALGKVVKTTKTFSMDTEESHKETKPSFFAFARTEHESSFLDGLLKK
ncbi:hypothetical protein DW172_03790 [Agathobacter rectalis]|uniref:Uncharacterized protein n=1 Tax=Agathobacter rectalis TaxID=39491 RepID=A0A414ZRD6_9FIRM|nr:hypothetical protein [Agathobacter rectalis]RHI25809.1 hypothetical protein DW172_03790 [Agathobacter rectalis]